MDLAIVFDGQKIRGDLVMNGSQPLTDNTLKNSVIISLFTWARAKPGDVLPDPLSTDVKGWWGDWYSDDAVDDFDTNGVLPIPVDRIGSRLWLLSREKVIPSVLAKAKEYTEEALSWMTDSTPPIAKSVKVTTEVSGPGILGALIVITKPDGTTEDYSFAYAWQGL